ncbi:MAG: hypothetical protein Q9210_001582 [Variospora velana]
MEFNQQPAIAQQSSKCLKFVKDLLQEYKEQEDTSTTCEHSPEDISDALARFKTWIENIGALQRGGSSLDHRLRHADLRVDVLRLLSQLLQASSDLWQIASGARTQHTWDTSDPIEFSDQEDGDSDKDESHEGTDRSPEGAGFSDGVSQVTTESQVLFSSILEAIASLLKLSMFIRKSTRGNKFAKSSRAQKYETQYDINHVRDRFPSASQSPHMVERLGKANAQRRQWLSYQRRHREKLAMPTALDDPGTSFGLTSAARHVDSVPQPPSSPPGAISGPSIWTEEHRGPYSVLSSTKASTFYQNDKQPREVMGTETSETSCSETSCGDLGFETNLVPQPPPEAADQNPFKNHMCTEHPGTFLPSQLPALAARAARPIHRIPASACPLCDYAANIKGKLNTRADEDPITVPIRAFRNHLGRHLEQLALFVLPKQDLMEQNDDVGESKAAMAGQVTISGDTGDSDHDEQSTSETRSK